MPSFVHRSVVRFSQVDAAGILYFSRAFELCHEAFEAWLAHAGLPLQPAAFARDWVLPIVHAEVDFHAPLRLGDAVDVEVRIDRATERSITFGFHLRAADGTPRATVRHVHAAVDARRFVSRALPDEIRRLVPPTAAEAP